MQQTEENRQYNRESRSPCNAFQVNENKTKKNNNQSVYGLFFVFQCLLLSRKITIACFLAQVNKI